MEILPVFIQRVKTREMRLRVARRSVARLINCTAKRITFTGGGSEANNLAIKGVAFSNWNSKNHIITTSIEHPSVISTCEWLEKHGFDVTYLEVDKTEGAQSGRFEIGNYRENMS